MHDPVQRFRSAILAALGHAPEVIEPGRFIRFATNERRDDDAGWCKLFDDLRGGVFGCHRHGISETWSADGHAVLRREQRIELARQVMTATAERDAQQRRRWAENAQQNARFWAQCVPLVPGDPAALYLERRGFGKIWPLPHVLRLHRALPYWHEGEVLGTFSAMVAPIVAPDGRTVALHRTYLTLDGCKADVPTPKKLTVAAGPLAGAAIPLHKPIRGCIGIAEGIETALAASRASSVPTVAAYCAGSLAEWCWPAGTCRLVIFADADKAGRKAAEKLLSRAVRCGLQVSDMTPTDPDSDWCDVWAARDAVMIESGSTA
jgi:putative DNA primase/helicase